MKLLKIKHIVFLSFLLILSGCNKETGPQTQPDVFLSVSARAAHTNGEESINMDTKDFEDRVHSLAMLVFDSGTGTKIAEHVTTTIGSGESTYAFTTKMTPGQRDFYFIANMPAVQAALSAITTKAEMDAFMQDVRELTAAHYLGASNEVGFPMARVYTNQTIASGGTASNPLPFKPNGESNVKLVRVVAKLEVILTEGVENLHTIELINANRHLSALCPDRAHALLRHGDAQTRGNDEPLARLYAGSLYSQYEMVGNGRQRKQPTHQLFPHYDQGRSRARCTCHHP